MRSLFLVLVACFVSAFTVSGQTDFPYFEVIQDDSVRLYVDAAHMFSSGVTRLTGRECARGYRLTRLNASGLFEGKFKDYLTPLNYPPVLMAEGTYKDGKKQGHFAWYHSNGKVMCEGVYVDDIPFGDWKIYSANGKLTLVLQFAGDQDPLINYMFDETSNLVIVKDGNGEPRFVSQLSEVPYNVSGRVRGGLPDGEWIGEAEMSYAGTPLTKKHVRMETYRAGVMVAGRKVQSGRITNVCCTPELTPIFPLPSIIDILDLESFPLEPCKEQVWVPSTNPDPVVRSAVPTSNINTFRSSIKAIILAKYRGGLVGESYNPTIPGNEENQLVIQFSTDEKGKPIRIKLVSAYGREFYQQIKRSLQSLTEWQPNQDKLILTVYIRMGVSTYNYRVNFSLD